jgi:hypothetical protein
MNIQFCKKCKTKDAALCFNKHTKKYRANLNIRGKDFLFKESNMFDKTLKCSTMRTKYFW